MVNQLKDKVAVVTGSGQGIGKAIAMAMAAEGASVVVNNRWPGTEGGDARTTAEEIIAGGGRAVPVFADVASFDDARKIIEAAVANFGRIDILVNNAGADAPHMVWNMTEAEWDICVDSYLKGSFNCIRHASVLMRQQKWGRLINTTSFEGLGTVGHCNYGAAKAGIVGLTEAVARELGRYGITCNAFAPKAATRFTLSGDTKSGFKKRFEAGLITREQYEDYTNPPEPETVAPMVVYLCTEAATDINAQVFEVAGGDVAIYTKMVTGRAIHKNKGLWTVEELIAKVPEVLLDGYVNPAPAKPAK